MKVKIIGDIDVYLGSRTSSDRVDDLTEPLLLTLKADLEAQFRTMIHSWRLKQISKTIKKLNNL